MQPIRDERPGIPWGRVAIWGFVCLVLCAWVLPNQIRGIRPQAGGLSDFFQDWASVRYFSEGRSIYSDQQDAATRELGRPVKRNHPREVFNEVNAHPPVGILLVLPVSTLRYPDAQVVWTLFWLLTVPVSCGIVLWQAGIRFRLWTVLMWIPLAILCMPLQEEVSQGQLNRAVLLLVVCAWALDRNDRPYLAGVCLALAISVKVLPAFLLLYFLCQRRWKTLAAVAVVGLSVNGLAAWLVGPSAVQDYVWRIVPKTAERYRDDLVNVSLVGYWTRLFDPILEGSIPLAESPLLYRVFSGASRLLIVAVAFWMNWRARTARARDHAFAATMTGALLLSPITWSPYFLLLIPSGVLLWRDVPPWTWRRFGFFAAVAYLWTATAVIITFVGRAHWRHTAEPWESLTYLGCATYALVALFLLGVGESRRANQDVASGHPSTCIDEPMHSSQALES